MKPNDTSSTLIRALGPWMAVAVVIGTIIGSGVFKKPQQVAAETPFFGLAALIWILGGVLALLGALSLAEVAVLYPKAGGNYVFLREGYGRLAGFLWGWVEFWMIRGGSLAALASVFSESLDRLLSNESLRTALGAAPNHDALGFWEERALTVAVIVGLAIINVRGVRWGGGLQVLITSVKVGSLLAILVLPFAILALSRGEAEGPLPSVSNLSPQWPASWSAFSWGGFGTALVGVMFAYHGWMNIAPVAEEVRHPQRNLPLALIGGTLTVIFLYLGANLAYALVIPAADMATVKDTTVATVFSERLLGPLGAAAASAAIMCSTFGALNGNLLVGPRLLYAMGEDGVAPRALSRVHHTYHTPAVAILVMAGWAAGLVIAVAIGTETGFLSPQKDHFNYLTDFAMFGANIFETLAVASIFVFRWKYPDVERAYRCPLYPWVPILYVLILVPVVINTFIRDGVGSLIGVGFIGVGGLLYASLFAGRKLQEEKKELTQSSSEG